MSDIKVVRRNRQTTYRTWLYARFGDASHEIVDNGALVTIVGTGYNLEGTELQVSLRLVRRNDYEHSFWDVLHAPGKRLIKGFEDIVQAQEFAEWLLTFSPVTAWQGEHYDDEAVQAIRYEAFVQANMALMSLYGIYELPDGHIVLCSPDLIPIAIPKDERPG